MTNSNTPCIECNKKGELYNLNREVWDFFKIEKINDLSNPDFNRYVGKNTLKEIIALFNKVVKPYKQLKIDCIVVKFDDVHYAVSVNAENEYQITLSRAEKGKE